MKGGGEGERDGLSERSVDRFQARYFPDRLNAKGQSSAALVSYRGGETLYTFEHGYFLVTLWQHHSFSY